MIDDVGAHQWGHRVPAGFGLLVDHHGAARQPRQRGGGGHPHRIEQLDAEAVELRCDAHHRRLVGRERLEDLLRQQLGQRAALAREAVERGAAVLDRPTVERHRCHAHGCGPPGGDLVHRPRQIAHVDAGQRGSEHPFGLGDRERELGATELEHLRLRTEPCDGERGLALREQHQVEAGRRMAAQRGEQGRARRAVELVRVVDHERHVGAEMLGERLGEEAGQAGGVGVVGRRATGEHRRVDGQPGRPQPQRHREACREHARIAVGPVHRVPGDRVVARPGRDAASTCRIRCRRRPW